MPYPGPDEVAAGIDDQGTPPLEPVLPAQFGKACHQIRRMLASAEARGMRLHAEGDMEEYNDLANGIFEVHDALSNTQYEDY